jgi:hypothetical protein
MLAEEGRDFYPKLQKSHELSRKTRKQGSESAGFRAYPENECG